MLERAIGNLVDNALKHADQGSPVDVVVDGTSVEVRDRGPGIDPADQPLVFDRFYRATTARTAPGSGLGLAIVRQIVERHGGQVWARNLVEGRVIEGSVAETWSGRRGRRRLPVARGAGPRGGGLRPALGTGPQDGMLASSTEVAFNRPMDLPSGSTTETGRANAALLWAVLAGAAVALGARRLRAASTSRPARRCSRCGSAAR